MTIGIHADSPDPAHSSVLPLRQSLNAVVGDIDSGGQHDAAARIMIVDDEPSTISILKKHLSGHGFGQFDTTIDPSNAVSLFAECKPDVVLLDVRMQKKSGLEVLKRN